MGNKKDKAREGSQNGKGHVNADAVVEDYIKKLRANRSKQD